MIVIILIQEHDKTKKRLLSDWICIQDGFLSFLLKLQFEDQFGLTDTDKVVKYILEQGFNVRAINVTFSDVARLEWLDEINEW